MRNEPLAVTFAQRTAIDSLANPDRSCIRRASPLVFHKAVLLNKGNPPSVRLRAWVMDELVDRLVANIGVDQMQGVTRELIAYAREKAGEDAVGEIVSSIPGLGQFV